MTASKTAIVRVLALITALSLLAALAACAGLSQNSSGNSSSRDDSESRPREDREPSGEPEQGSTKEDTAPPKEKPPPKPTPSPEPDDVDDAPSSPAPPYSSHLTYEEAYELCSDWVGKRANLSSYTVYKEDYESYDYPPPPPTFFLFEDSYYEFSVYYYYDDTYSNVNWHIVLVHEQTGEMLSRLVVRADGEPFTETLELLDDWYNGKHSVFPPARLTAAEAIAVYDAWMEARFEDPDTFNFRLNGENYGKYAIFADQYYYFNADDDYAYWYNILVHMQTGELLFFLTSDGQYPEKVIETLEEWFDGW